MAKVSISNLSKIYPRAKAGGVTALRDLNAEFGEREFVIVAGPGASGKTTLLRLLAGLEQVSSGVISIADRPVNDVPPKDRDVALVLRDDPLYPHMTVAENLAFGLKRRKFTASEIKRRIDEAATVLGVGENLSRKPGELSPEQRQRTAIARAIARQPKVLLFDDPLADLEAPRRAQLRLEIARLHQRVQSTFVYATGDATEAMALAERVVLLNDGALQQSDTPAAIYDQPVNLAAAQFVGTPPINVISGTLKADRDGVMFRESGDGTIELRLPSSAPEAAHGFVGKSVMIGIRPEDIAIAEVTGAKHGPPGSFPALVDVVERTGAAADVYLTTGAHTLICRSSMRLSEGESGRRMRFAVNADRAHLFDPASGLRLV